MRKLMWGLALLGLVLSTASCGGKHTAPTPEVVMVGRATLPVDPVDPAWQSVPEHVAKLLLQDMVEPRLLLPSTAEVRVRAIHNNVGVAFRLEWSDSTDDDVATPSRFSDACAVQLPMNSGADLPAPQMGESERPVEITYWNAGWQAIVDGRADTITAIYPNASIDHYPFEARSLDKNSTAQHEMAARYAPARALGNPMAGPREVPVQDLIAEGAGTLTPAASTRSRGRGVRTSSGWAVVIIRPLPGGLTAQSRSQVAFAVWEGSRQEAGARKMRTGWVPLSRETAP
ncbi:MAG: ethylbenzene dehydrogenase-related protein [Candidatus Zixiibacteriota bacterium]